MPRVKGSARIAVYRRIRLLLACPGRQVGGGCERYETAVWIWLEAVKPARHHSYGVYPSERDVRQIADGEFLHFAENCPPAIWVERDFGAFQQPVHSRIGICAAVIAERRQHPGIEKKKISFG